MCPGKREEKTPGEWVKGWEPPFIQRSVRSGEGEVQVGRENIGQGERSIISRALRAKVKKNNWLERGGDKQQGSEDQRADKDEMRGLDGGDKKRSTRGG